MKTTVEIEDELLRQAKKLAVDRGCSLRDLVEGGLRAELEREHRQVEIPKVGEWVTGPIALPEGVDIGDRTTLWDWIERERKHSR